MDIAKKELPLARSMCWHCQSDIGGEYFCQQCVKVQPLSKDMDYFTALSLPRKLNIDTGMLETKFYEMSRAFHPDFYEGKSEMERAVSLANSATLNQAYHTLKDPIERVEYLLRLEAGSAKEIPGKPPTDLFETLLEIQEQLEELQRVKAQHGTGSQEILARLRAERGTLASKRAALEGRLAELFHIWDRLVDRSASDQAYNAEKGQVLKQMRDILSQRNYLNTMLANIAEALE
jgi:molecular chaperone HscB